MRGRQSVWRFACVFFLSLATLVALLASDVGLPPYAYDHATNVSDAAPAFSRPVEITNERRLPVLRGHFGVSAISSRDFVGAETASGGSGSFTQLFRITDEPETADIANTGAYRTLPMQEGKYFFPTAEQGTNLAEMFGTKASTAGNHSLTSGWVPSDLVDQFVPITNAGEGAGYLVPEEFLPQLSNVQIHGPAP